MPLNPQSNTPTFNGHYQFNFVGHGVIAVMVIDKKLRVAGALIEQRPGSLTLAQDESWPHFGWPLSANCRPLSILVPHSGR